MSDFTRQQAAHCFSALPSPSNDGDLTASDLAAIDAAFGIRQGSAPARYFAVKHKRGAQLLGQYEVMGTHSFAVADEAHERLCDPERGDYVLVTDLGVLPRSEIVRPWGAVPVAPMREDPGFEFQLGRQEDQLAAVGALR